MEWMVVEKWPEYLKKAKQRLGSLRPLCGQQPPTGKVTGKHRLELQEKGTRKELIKRRIIRRDQAGETGLPGSWGRHNGAWTTECGRGERGDGRLGGGGIWVSHIK